MLVDEVPRDWLAGPAALPVSAEPAAAAAGGLPDDYEAYLGWRRGAEAPEAGWRGVSVEASGPARADVMVLVDCPERDDDAAGLLTKGAAGALFERMLAAVGLSRAAVHIASVCLRRPPPGRIGAEVEARLSELALHHVALVAPRRLLVMGDAASRAVLGTNVMAARDGLRPIKHKGGTTGVVASFHPRLLLERPAAKAEAWKDLQALVNGMGEE